MKPTTKISWTQHTWNPIAGCRHASPGCDHCYAERMAKRLRAMGQRKYRDVVDADGWTGEKYLDGRALENPPKSGLVFVESMADLFWSEIPDGWIDDVYSAMAKQFGATFQVLTKHPQRALTYYDQARAQVGKEDGFPSPWDNLPNVWLGVSAENQKCADQRLPILQQIPAAVQYVSLEPLLGPVNLNLATPCDRNCNEYSYAECPGTAGLCVMQQRLDWVIVGCESGPGRRECKTEWIASVVRQCYAAEVPVFVKQMQIGGKVERDAEKIAEALDTTAGQIRQWPVWPAWEQP